MTARMPRDRLAAAVLLEKRARPLASPIVSILSNGNERRKATLSRDT